MIRDRDRIYGTVVTRRLRAMGIRDEPIAPASPWQNGFAERLIESLRRECLDHIIVLGEEHLRRILKNYAAFYNGVRTLGLCKRMRRSLVRFNDSAPKIRTPSWADGTYTCRPSTTSQSIGDISPSVSDYGPNSSSSIKSRTSQPDECFGWCCGSECGPSNTYSP
jgi:hypothetical protein